jgi:cytochrome c oxidase subunit 2
MKYGKHLFAVIGLIIVSSVALFFLLSAIYQRPPAASAEATPIDTLMTAHFALISFLFSLVMVFVLYSLYFFRRRPDDDGEGDHFHGHTGLEVVWTILPLAAVVFFGVWGAQVLADITREEPDEMAVRVVGQQWSWFFEYPEEGDLRSLEMVLPKDQVIRLQMESLDVLHSFWVPEFRVKQDLVPGQITELRITPNEIGEYSLVCAEICGAQHSTMMARVRVLEPADFDAWVQEQQSAALPDDPAERGAVWFEQYGCNACHSTDGTVLVGPTWRGLWGSEHPLEDGSTVVVDEEHFRRSILEPDAQIFAGFQPGLMPQNFGERMAEDEGRLGPDIDIINDLIEFAKTLEE